VNFERDPLAGKIPVTLITGFLGSGKTTLISRLVKHPEMNRVAVVINEMGEIGIDHDLVTMSSENITLLANGCICCSVRTDMQETLRELFAQRVNNNQIALDKNYISNDAWLPDATALQDIQKQSNDLERQINQTRHDFNSLLGLSPDAQVELKNEAALAELDEVAVVQNIAQLPAQRPDLLALRAGFDAQDERYRAALLAQFPSLTVGFTRARDNSGVYSNGIGVNLTLPLLNRNRGNIAIEQATREKLYDDYQQRLNSASSDIHKLLQDQHINLRQLNEIQTALIQYQATVDHADIAYQKNIVDTLVYSNAHSVLLTKQIEAISLQQSIMEQRIALQALIGGDLPLQRTAENHHHDQ